MTAEPGRLQDREDIRTLVSRSVRSLNEGRFADFIALFAADGRYVLQADSAEIGQTMTWLDLDRDELGALLDESPQHVHDLAARKHMVAVDEFDFADDGASVEALSGFAVFRTDIDGRTEVYAVGNYEDRLVRDGNDWRIAQRLVRVQTRMFRTPTPTPL
ncbi:MAG: nuclear transport factor 2 family protein [Alphaproteobacteria bacterium]